MTAKELDEAVRLASRVQAEPDIDDDQHCICRECSATFYVNFGSSPSALCRSCAYDAADNLARALLAVMPVYRAAVDRWTQRPNCTHGWGHGDDYCGDDGHVAECAVAIADRRLHDAIDAATKEKP